MIHTLGHLLLKFGGGEAMVEQGRDAVALGQMEEVGPGDGFETDRDASSDSWGALGAQKAAEPFGRGRWRRYHGCFTTPTSVSAGISRRSAW